MLPFLHRVRKGYVNSQVALPPAHASPLSICLQLTLAISRSERLDDVFEAALNALSTGLHLDRTSILLFDADGVMRFKAWRGLSDGYRHAVEGHTPWTHHTRDAHPIVVADVTTDASLAPHLPTFAAEEIAALAFIPLEDVNGVIGKFMLYYRDRHHLLPEELEFAAMVAAQVAFAVSRTRTLLLVKESEERLRFALDAAHMGTWDWDLQSHSVRWSDNVERIHGLPEGSFDGTFLSYEREIHPDDREKVLASIQRALADGVPHQVEYRLVGPDGTIRWVEGKGRVEFGPNGKPIRMTGVCMNVTPRKQIELARMEALEDSNRASQRLAAIVESSDDAIVSKSLEGTIMSWNRSAERMFGYSAAEAIGRSILLIVPPDRRAEEEKVLTSICAGLPMEMETVRRRKDGTLINISLKVSPIKDAAGRIVGASKIARDITARKRNEAERAEFHRRLSTLVTASASLLDSPETQSVLSATLSVARQLLVADGYAVWATDTDRAMWHAAASEGVSSAFASRMIPVDDVIQEVLSDSLPVEDVIALPLLEEQRSAYRDEGVCSILVCPMRLAGRSATLVFYYRTPHVFTQVDVQTGQALANLAAAAMTTAELYDEQRRQRHSAELARRQATFLADAAGILSRSLDYEQTLTAVARLAVPEIADWCAVDILDAGGRLLRVAVAPPGAEEVERARILEDHSLDPTGLPGALEVIRTGVPALVATITPERLAAGAPDEHFRTLPLAALTSYMCVPLVSSRGTLGALTFVFAESGRHYSERDLPFAQDVAARAVLAIDNAFAYRRAHEANRLKDEFLATLSHELRTPLNAILGYAQMLTMGLLDGERQSNALSVLTRNAEVLRQIIDDVLDVSRITSGKLRLNVRPVELMDVLASAIATVQPAADAKGVALEIVPTGDVGAVSGDPDRLQQVLWNLLSNGVKFTPRGGRVQVRIQDREAAVEIVVSDNGQGVPSSFLPYIFERFRQADGRFSREHGGLGLGLAIVRELVELHGGTVTASSDGPGSGAVFIVQLPRMRTRPAVTAGDQEAPSLPFARSEQPPERASRAPILTVDD